MKLSVEKEFYEFLEGEIESHTKFEELKSVIEDLSEVSLDGDGLTGHYERNLGGEYGHPEGFVCFVRDLVDVINFYYSRFNFDFEASDCIRTIIFEVLTPFIEEKVDGGELSGNMVVLYYLQLQGINLSYYEFKYLSWTGSNKNQDFMRFIYGMQMNLMSVKERNVLDEGEDGERDVFEGENVVDEKNENKNKEDEDTKNEQEDEAAASFDELFNN